MTSHVTVRAFAHGDLASVERIVPAAFGHHVSPRLAKRLASQSMRGFVAERAGTVVGFAGLSLFGTIAFVGSMAVDPHAQRTGVGASLMRELIAYCESHGPRPMALDATAAGEPLYAKFGFDVTDRTLVLRRAATLTASSSAALPSADALDRAIAFDADALGCDRSIVLRLLANESHARTIASDDGFVICWNDSIGPWLARSAEAARDVFSLALAQAPHVTRALVRESNAAAVAIARDHGFEIERSAAHMSRGPSPFSRATVFGRASHSHG